MLAMTTSCCQEIILGTGTQPVLENIAVAPGRSPERPGRHPGRPMERPHEVGQVTEPDVERDVRNRPGLVGQQAGGVTEPRADEVLMGCQPQYAREDAQEVKATQPGLSSRAVEIQRLVRVRVHPLR